MKKNEKHDKRLLVFAEHLSKLKQLHGNVFEYIELVELEEKVRIHYKVKYNYLLLDELPNVFAEFYYNEINGSPTLKGVNPEEENSIAGVMNYFGLSPDMFAHLFDVEGYQNTILYGGKELSLTSGPSDFASNIVEFVKWRSENCH